MSEEHPFDEYLVALEEFREGKVSESANRITRAIGGKETTPEIFSNISEIFRVDSDIHKMIIDLLTRRTTYDTMPST